MSKSASGCFAFWTGTNGDVAPANVNETAGSTRDSRIRDELEGEIV